MHSQSRDAVIPSEDTDEIESRRCDLEETVKDLEKGIAYRFVDYMALYEELNPTWDVVQEQRERVINLTEQLVPVCKYI